MIFITMWRQLSNKLTADDTKYSYLVYGHRLLFATLVVCIHFYSISHAATSLNIVKRDRKVHDQGQDERTQNQDQNFTSQSFVGICWWKTCSCSLSNVLCVIEAAAASKSWVFSYMCLKEWEVICMFKVLSALSGDCWMPVALLSVVVAVAVRGCLAARHMQQWYCHI